MPPLLPSLRLAIFVACRERCVWCSRPLQFSEMEVEHLIPKSLAEDDLVHVLAAHGLPPDYDLNGLQNFASSCRPCNAGKGRKPPPSAPLISLLLQEAQARVPEVERSATEFREGGRLEVAIATIESVASDRALNADEVKRLESAARALAPVISRTAIGRGPRTIHLHPTMTLLVAGADRWEIVRELGRETVVVSDGRFTGVTGTDASFICPFCGSHGPWDGVICRTCGQRSEPD